MDRNNKPEMENELENLETENLHRAGEDLNTIVEGLADKRIDDYVDSSDDIFNPDESLSEEEQEKLAKMAETLEEGLEIFDKGSEKVFGVLDSIIDGLDDLEKSIDDIMDDLD